MRKLRTIEMHRLTVEDYKKSDKLPLVVVLDDVRSMYNVGSVFRTADAFRVEAVYLCGVCATPPSAEIHKTALGAEDSVEWRYFTTAEEAVSALHDDGYEVMAVEQAEGSTELDDFRLGSGNNHDADREGDETGRYAVVLGNEVKGVHQEVIDACDGCLEIKQYGTKHSMNVSVTAGIIMHHFSRLMRGWREQ